MNLRDLWTYRELLYFLAWRDIKVRYKQTLLGVVWAIIQPLSTMLLFTLVFGQLARVPSDSIPYPLFAYAALLPWTFFSNAVGASGNSLVGSAHLITKVYFPRMIVPGAAVVAGLADFAIASVILIGLIAYYGVPLTWAIAMLPALLSLTVLFAIGIGLFIAGLNVKYRDVRHALPFLMQLWMFATPIIYPSSFVPEGWRWALMLNPLAGIIEGYRAALVGRGFDWPGLGLSAAITLIVVVFATYRFRMMEGTFADVI